jgi:hypothetical protein
MLYLVNKILLCRKIYLESIEWPALRLFEGLALSLSKGIIAFLKNLIAFIPEKKYIVCLRFYNAGTNN